MSIDWRALLRAEGADPELLRSATTRFCRIEIVGGVRVFVGRFRDDELPWWWREGDVRVHVATVEDGVRAALEWCRAEVDRRIADLQRERARLGGAT